MATKLSATIDDLYRVDGKAELVHGELVMMSPTGAEPNIAAGAIYRSLCDYADRLGRGAAFTDNMAFVVDLPHRQSFSPDAAFYIGPLSMKFVTGAPLFAAEVRSEHDYGLTAERAMAEKRADYFAAGTQVVWDVDLLSNDRIRVYRNTNPTEPTVYHPGATAEAEPALPGWIFVVDSLLSPQRK